MTDEEQKLLEQYLTYLNVLGDEGEYPNFKAWYQEVRHAQGPGHPTQPDGSVGTALQGRPRRRPGVQPAAGIRPQGLTADAGLAHFQTGTDPLGHRYPLLAGMNRVPPGAKWGEALTKTHKDLSTRYWLLERACEPDQVPARPGPGLIPRPEHQAPLETRPETPILPKPSFS